MGWYPRVGIQGYERVGVGRPALRDGPTEECPPRSEQGGCAWVGG